MENFWPNVSNKEVEYWLKLGAQLRKKDHIGTSNIILLKWMLNHSDLMKMGTKKDICFLLIPSKIKDFLWLNEQFIIILYVDFNYLSKLFYFLILILLMFFHNNCTCNFTDLFIKCFSTFEKKCIFPSENIFSIYLFFFILFCFTIDFSKKIFLVLDHFGPFLKFCVRHMSNQIYIASDSILTDG